MAYINDIIIKRVQNGTSGIINFNFKNENNIYNYIVRNLENDNYFHFDSNNEFLVAGKSILKNLENNQITENLLKNGIYIYPNSAYYMVSKYSNKICEVPSQYDEPYNSCSNQCTWISLEFSKNKNNIISAISNNNIEELKTVYINCLQKGTECRKEFGKILQGENLDEIDENIKNKLKSAIYGNSSILSVLESNVVKMIIKPDVKTFEYSYFLNEIDELKNKEMMILNRDGQTFVFLKFNDKFYIFDSHIRNIFSKNKTELIDYILEDNHDGFFYILWYKD
jgi:hypothetical protein